MCIENERGFTLIESLLHCVIFSVVALGLAMLLVVCMHIPTTQEVFEDVEFEVVSYDLNNLLLDNVKQVSFDKSYSNKVTVTLDKLSEKDIQQNLQGIFEIIISPPYLYRSKGNGFEPLIGTVHAHTKWDTHPEGIHLYLKTLDHYERERYFYVPKYIQ